MIYCVWALFCCVVFFFPLPAYTAMFPFDGAGEVEQGWLWRGRLLLLAGCGALGPRPSAAGGWGSRSVVLTRGPEAALFQQDTAVSTPQPLLLILFLLAVRVVIGSSFLAGVSAL